jgi:hypothetical protein
VASAFFGSTAGGGEFHRGLISALDLYPQPLDPKDFTSFIEREANVPM